MKEVKSIEVRRDRVKIEVVERDRWGAIRHRQQLTFHRRGFENALRAAEMTVPWEEVRRP